MLFKVLTYINKRHFCHYNSFTGNGRSDQSKLSTAAVIFAMTLIISVVSAVVLTFIITYVCVKRTHNRAINSFILRDQSPEPQEKLLGEQECPSSYTSELQPNPAYDASHGY